MRPILQGSVDQSVVIRVVDSTDGTPETTVAYNTTGVDLWYRREGAASVDITEATLAALTTAHTDGGFLHINDGYCRLDLPDAAVAAGATGVTVGGTFTGMVVIGTYIPLEDPSLKGIKAFGVGTSPGAAALTMQAGPNYGTNTLRGNLVWVRGATQGYWQENSVLSNTSGTTPVLTFADNFPVTPAGAPVDYIIFGTPAASTANPLLVQLAPITHTSAIVPTVTTLTNMPAITANWLTAAGIASDVTTELQAGLATAAALTAVDDFIDTEVGTLITNLATLATYVDTEMAAVLAKVNFLPSITAGAAGGLLIAGTNAATAFTGGLTATFTGNLTGNVGGNVAGSVGSVVGAVASVTGNVGGSVASVTGFTPTDIATIIAKTDNLPADPADASDIAALIAAVNVLTSFQKAFLVNWEITNVTTTSANLRVWPVGTAHVSGTGELAIIPLVRADETSAWTKATL